MPLLLISEIVVILASVHLIGIALIVLVIIVSAGERTARRRKPSGTRRQRTVHAGFSVRDVGQER